MLGERLESIKRVQDQIDIRQGAEQLEAFVSLIGGVVFEVALQLPVRTIILAL